MTVQIIRRPDDPSDIDVLPGRRIIGQMTRWRSLVRNHGKRFERAVAMMHLATASNLLGRLIS